MAEFNAELIRDTLIKEGGYQNRPNDLGGPTKYGISQRTYPKLDIFNLTVDEAVDIYQRDYWDAYNLTQINNQLLADQIFDMFFNMSNISAAITLQLALNNCEANVILDGKMGPQTINAVNEITPQKWLIVQIKVERCRFYLGRVDASPDQLENFRSWIRRAIA